MCRLKANLLSVLLLATAGLLMPRVSAAGPIDLDAALAQAKPGDTIRVPAGIYPGPLVIERRITLMGEPGAIIDGGGQGNVVAIKAAGTVFRGFTVRGSGEDLERDEAGIWVTAPNVTVESNTLADVLFGVCVHQAAGATVRGNTITGKMNLEIARRGDGIRLWYSPDCVIESNEVHDVRDVVIWFSKNVRLTSNHVRDSRYGLHFMYCDDNTLQGNRLEHNSVGCYLMNSRKLTLHGNILADNRGPSGYGIGLKDMDGVDARDNRIVGNRIGVYIDTSPQSVDVYDYFVRNLIACNDAGVAVLPSCQRNVFQDNSFVENQEQVAILGSGELHDNVFTVNGRGNFWSDYKGFDLNGDGVGDLPYRCQSLFENLMDREPKLRFFLYSPAQQAIEMASQAFPAVRPRAKLTDDAPLMRPVELHVSAPAPEVAWQPVAGGATLLLLGGLPLVGPRVLAVLGRRTNAKRRTRGLVARFVDRLHLPPLPPGEGRSEGKPATTLEQPVRRSQFPLTATLSRRERVQEGLAVLKVAGLTKRFGRFAALDGLSFQVDYGQALALWGSNGAGKTTAIRCILGLVRSTGRVTIAGRALRPNGKALRGLIGYVSQESSFQADLSVVDALRLYARIKGAPMLRVEQLLAEVGLAEHRAKKIGNLSGGMRKRLALAAALLNDPPLLMLDEIAANLDAEARHAFLTLLADLKQQGKTILFTSHRMDEVELLADRVIVLDRGKLRHDCPPHELGRTLGLRCDVKLALPPELIGPALGLLHSNGFAARRNGRGIAVRVEAGQKAAPIHLLARHDILIENFDVETLDAEQSHV